LAALSDSAHQLAGSCEDSTENHPHLPAAGLAIVLVVNENSGSNIEDHVLRNNRAGTTKVSDSNKMKLGQTQGFSK
jgi:hypothetical protein